MQMEGKAFREVAEKAYELGKDQTDAQGRDSRTEETGSGI